MKLRFLLLFMVITSMICAQEPYQNLVITEARMIEGDFNDCYFEITNMGETDIDSIKVETGNYL